MASKYNFKSMVPVPGAKDMIDIMLSKTNRQTPTVVHPQFKISRIRAFYMRKVKFTQQNFHDRLTQILEDFPRLDDIHPFYADLINVLYSRDHYKLALGQVNTARTLIDNIAKDYVAMLKVADSAYRCKELKRAALGRMCTVIKKLANTLGYLEDVRKHLSRLPCIEPNTRTLLITGYPNVGKSSFMNKVSRANVDVQPYAFTTKSLFVGHFDYKYMRWQVIDTPGILDHPLEERNVIEMQSVTALAHLQATILYFIDLSESCGYTIEQQVSLYHNIKPLFVNKPILIVCSKSDLKKLEDLTPEQKALVESMQKGRPVPVVSLSTNTEQGVNEVVTTACDLLLAHRVEKKLSSKRVEDVRNRMEVTLPTPRDKKPRPVHIPESVRKQREEAVAGGTEAAASERKLLKHIEAEEGGPGVFNFNLRNHWQLENPEWANDIIPEIMDGKNVLDFYDPEIEQRLKELEAEEEALLAQEAAAAAEEEESDGLDDEQKELAERIIKERKLVKAKRDLEKTNNKPAVPRPGRRASLSEAEAKLTALGLDPSKLKERARSRSRGRKRTREEAGLAYGKGEVTAMDESEDGASGEKKARSRSRSRVRSKTPAEEGLKDEKQKKDAAKLARKQQRKLALEARKGEADRKILNLKPKHLFSGKQPGHATRHHR